jgi:hypothetical protein
MTTTVGKSVPPQTNETFTVIEMDSPVNATAGNPFKVTINITGDPGSDLGAVWTFARDHGGQLQIELFADTIGPGTDLKLLTHTEPLVAGQDAYGPIDLNDDGTGDRPTFPATADKGVYELAAVITVTSGGAPLGLSAFVGDAILQVS